MLDHPNVCIVADLFKQTHAPVTLSPNVSSSKMPLTNGSSLQPSTIDKVNATSGPQGLSTTAKPESQTKPEGPVRNATLLPTSMSYVSTTNVPTTQQPVTHVSSKLTLFFYI